MQVSLVQSLEQMGRRGDIRDDSAEILFQSFMRETLVSSSGIGRSVHSLMLSIQHFLCRPRRRPPSKVPRRMFCGGCHGVWHARTMQIFLSSQLPEEVLVDPQGSWSCSAPVVGLPLQVGDTEKFPRLKRQLQTELYIILNVLSRFEVGTLFLWLTRAYGTAWVGSLHSSSFSCNVLKRSVPFCCR